MVIVEVDPNEHHGCDACDCHDHDLPFYGIRLKRTSEQIPAKAIFVQADDEQLHCYTLLGYHPARHGLVEDEEEFRIFKAPKWTVVESDLVGSTVPYKDGETNEEWDYFLYAPISAEDLVKPALLQAACAIPLTIDESELTEYQFFNQVDDDDEDYDPEDSNGEDYYTNDYPDSYGCEVCGEEECEDCDCCEDEYCSDEDDCYDDDYEYDDDDGVDILGEHLAKFSIEVDEDGKCPHSLYIEYCDECLEQQEKLYELREEMAHQMYARKVVSDLRRQMGLHNNDYTPLNVDGRIQEVRDECEARESGRVYHTPYGRHVEAESDDNDDDWQEEE